MEDCNNKGEVHANFTKQKNSSARSGISLKSISSGRSSPQNSPSFQRPHSTLTPRREGKGVAQCYGSNRLLLWLLVITLWAYLGFCVQSRWAHDDKEGEFSGFKSRPSDATNSYVEQNQHHDLIAKNISLSVNIEQVGNQTMDVALAKKEYGVLSPVKSSSRKRRRRPVQGKRRRKHKLETSDLEELEPEIPPRNSTYGFLVGPFGSLEDRILKWSPQRRYETCDTRGDFARLVWSRKFVLIFHELSMTGAPLSMMELATELLSCEASVYAVVLSRKGGLMQELARRHIKVLDDKAYLSFKTAAKADLVIAGSAVCASWIEQYIERFPAGASKVAWWIMENRREYFDRAKDVLHRVKILIFLSEAQSKQWQKWCEEESIKLRLQPALVPLSVNDELAFVAGIPSTLNAPSFGAEKMDERRKLLRDSVRREMGLSDNDMLVMTLSSINRGKGQLFLLESARSIVEDKPFHHDNKKRAVLSDDGEYLSTLSRRHHVRKLFENSSVAFNNISSTFINSKEVFSHNNGTTAQSLKILIGSVGSKSNKVDYVKGLLRFLAQHSNLSKSVLWTSATTRVASLYSAADVYVTNSQGLGETFGRVTIEAMAFGLPVLGTDAGGTQEIVEHNVTGLLHPIGRTGNHVLAQHLRFLLENSFAREKMGMEGRKKVQRMFLKQNMYEKFVDVLVICMRTK
ncbi:hypothetical protein VNO80_00171 [Phaseolus coccineus]|uniref:Glycosyl transferase family 1 domain-containing protein n=1 Tax=Phaseolus coccineus TaxID=3886 RepID=A0AAN9NZJ9_PHACN